VKYNWNWGIFWQLSPDGRGTYLDTLIAGLGWTLATALAAWLIALALGMIVGVIRTTPVNWMRRVGDAWVEVFRNVPLLVQMFIWFFVVPELLPTARRSIRPSSASASTPRRAWPSRYVPGSSP
jgi:glutamate/aspartate transport system permease protein